MNYTDGTLSRSCKAQNEFGSAFLQRASPLSISGTGDLRKLLRDCDQGLNEPLMQVVSVKRNNTISISACKVGGEQKIERRNSLLLASRLTTALSGLRATKSEQSLRDAYG